MQISYRSDNADFRTFYGQFLLTATQKEAPQSWGIQQHSVWKLYTNRLPVLDILDLNGVWVGWCLGYPIINGHLKTDKIVLNASRPHIDLHIINDFYDRTSGKWLIILLEANTPKIFIDPYGSLAAVYSAKEQSVASTPTLLSDNHEWNEGLIRGMGLPEIDTFLPSGLTSRKDLKRILANHFLNLSSWKTERHWPLPETNLSICADIAPAVIKITNNLQTTIDAIAAVYPICFSLTAGMDSRMLLACSRKHVDRAQFFTLTGEKESFDKAISRILAEKHKLNHQFFYTEKATHEELEQWLARTGYNSGGGIWRSHKSLNKLEAERVLMPGTAGEIGRRTMMWRQSDKMDTPIDPKRIYERYRMPQHPEVVRATEEWLAGIQHFDTFTQLSLVFIEQRLCCWGGPQHYGNNHSIFEFTPFNSRTIFQTSMRLPIEYRRSKKLPVDMIRATWPELLELPFNQHPGMKGFIDGKVASLKTFVKGILGR